MIARTLRSFRSLPGVVGLLLVAIYLSSYVSNPAVPGNAGRFPLGWWGWWDQSQYILSARSLAHGDLAPGHHWYPLGYAVLGAPFTLLSRLHPFLVPDLGCLLLSYLAFLVFSRCVGLSATWGALSFLLATCGSEALRNVWAEPWNTSLSSTLIWWLLALTALQLVRPTTVARVRLRRLAIMGALVAAIPFVRPTDSLLVVVWAGGAAWLGWREAAVRPRELAALMLGAVVVLVPEAALWLGMYGAHESQYMINSRVLGFAFDSAGWKTYLLLSTPRPWFPYGAGIVQRLPWVMPGLAGMLAIPFIARGVSRGLLALMAAMIVAYCLLFFCYVDLIPSGLWRYNNIHYFKWTLPGLVLLGMLLLRALLRGPRRPALAALAAVLALTDLRFPPRPATVGQPAWMIQVPGPVPGFDEAYFTSFILHDARGAMQPIRDFRAFPDRDGWRLIALHRPFTGALVISGLGHRPDGPVSPDARRWSRGLSLRLPCWLHACPPVP